MQLETVARRESPDACALARLRDAHPTLYWNFVVLVVVTGLDCDLSFLQLPSDGTVTPFRSLPSSTDKSAGDRSTPQLRLTVATGGGGGCSLGGASATTTRGSDSVRVGTVLSTTAGAMRQRQQLTRHRSMLPTRGSTPAGEETGGVGTVSASRSSRIRETAPPTTGPDASSCIDRKDSNPSLRRSSWTRLAATIPTASNAAR